MISTFFLSVKVNDYNDTELLNNANELFSYTFII